jgi:hypothetical protein
MLANKTLLQRKYARIIAEFANKKGLPLRRALDLFYKSDTYLMMRDGVGYMHCRSDLYLAEELCLEMENKIND